MDILPSFNKLSADVRVQIHFYFQTTFQKIKNTAYKLGRTKYDAHLIT